MRQLKYREAIAEATLQAMRKDKTVFVMGEGVDDPKGIFGTTRLAYEAFGGERVFDVPLCENSQTGWGTGAALMGMKPVMVHARNDFVLLAMDQIANHAAKWNYLNRMRASWTMRTIIGRGWGQAAQHSQSLQATFAHFPGLKVVMPATPYDAKGLLIAAIFDPSPVIVIEHRKLYEKAGNVPKEFYKVPLGRANVLKSGRDVTIVAVSDMVRESLKAIEALEGSRLEVELIDVRTIKPLDAGTIIRSVKKTGRLVVCDTSWIQFGVSAEISSVVCENAFKYLKAPIIRIGLPDCPTPCSYSLEEVFYPDHLDIIDAVKRVLSDEKAKMLNSFKIKKIHEVDTFKGPF